MTTVLWIIAAIVIVNILLVTFWYFFRDKEEKPSVEPVEKPSEPVSNQEPTTEPEKPVEPKFKAGDWVVYEDGIEYCIMQILEINTNTRPFLYRFTNSYSCYGEEYLRAWDITKDAKDGDVLVSKSTNKKDIDICIFKCFSDIKNSFTSYCSFVGSLNRFDSREIPNWNKDFFIPATKEQRELLFSKMAEEGYTWDADTKTLRNIDEEPLYKQGDRCRNKENPKDEVVILAIVADQYKYYGTGYEFEKYEFFKPFETQYELINEEPKEEETDLVEMVRRKIEDVIDYFAQVVPIGEKTRKYLLSLSCPDINFYDKSLFHVVYNYYGDMENDYVYEQFYAWVFGLVLSELVPDKRQEIMQMAYDYKVKGKDQPTYGYTFETDPNIARLVASSVYASTRDAAKIHELRKEVGGKMLTYKIDISECFIDCTKFMPTAPPPFIKGYENRPKGTPVDADNTACVDEQINDYVAQYYNLDTKDAEKRQATIQAIANKEYHKQHLFGKDRTVTDKVYGTMTIRPVFGKHNLGIEIPDDGAIANLVYDMGKICSATRISLLNQEYGRKRPGMGDTDGSMNPDERHRALVNYAIEEGDGHTTGYYDKGGYYVDGNGNYIGDYVTYYQGQLYANSYPSGHSAFIMGVGMLLMEVMPDKADKILQAVNEFANSRVICRYHNQSDTTHGKVIGTMMIPVLHATTNYDLDGMVNKAKDEYQRILNGDVTPEPTPEPTEKVNTSLAYAIGGYGSCHVDAGEKEMVHRCTKQCTKERHPAIQVNQRVTFTIEGGGVTTDDGKTSGVWEANKAYGIKCPAVTEDRIATITMWNENGTRVLEYRCSKDGTHDDGPKEI